MITILALGNAWSEKGTAEVNDIVSSGVGEEWTYGRCRTLDQGEVENSASPMRKEF